MNDFIASTLSLHLKIPHIIARFFVSRGIKTVEKASRILYKKRDVVLSPWAMFGMQEAVEWILERKKNSEKIFIFGDYDLDGMTSVSLLTRGFKELGITSEWRLPNRFGDGYGLSIKAIDELHQAGAKFLLTVDTGITANAEIAYAKTLGIRVLVVDHHEPSGDGLPDCDIILDPHQENDTYPNIELCGVGVSYKLMCALYEKFALPEPTKFLDLVAMGTLADLVGMTPENRYFTKFGLKQFENSLWPGVKTLYHFLQKPKGRVSGIDVMFRIAPLLNAPGRIERPDPALKLLLADDPKDTRERILELQNWNKLRKEKEAEITEKAILQVRKTYGENLPKVIIASGKDWHVGVIGIVSAKLAQEFSRPVAVLSITEGIAHASARAVPGFNWHQALFNARELFIRWGGHMNAAGFTLEEKNIPELTQKILQSAEEQNYTVDENFGENPHAFDIKIALRELEEVDENNKNILDYFEELEPFGGNFPYPVFKAENVLVHRVRELKGGHLQVEISQKGSAHFSAIAFRQQESKIRPQVGRLITIVFDVNWNYFNGKKLMQLCIKAFE